MDDLLTLMAPHATLDDGLVRHVAHSLGASCIEWLAPAEAADLSFDDTPMPGPQRVARLLAGHPVDAIRQSRHLRRKQLLIADMDSTLVTTETLDELAAFAGVGAEVAAITHRSMNGQIAFEQALVDRVALLKGLDVAALDSTWSATRITPGADALVATMRAHGATCAIASGGFTCFTTRLAALLGFDAQYANVLEVRQGRLTGALEGAVLGRDGKRAALYALAAERNIPIEATMAVGDGANDLDMLAAAGAGIAFHAKPVVAHASRMRIDHCDLRALLFIQGYRPPHDGGPIWD